MVRDELCVVAAALRRQSLDPLRRAAMLLRALATRDLRVRDVADERMRECVFDLVCNRAAPLTADEPLALEEVEDPFELGPGATGSVERAQPEDLADDRGALEQLLLLAFQAVETRGDYALQRLRERQLVGACQRPATVAADEEAPVDEHPHVLLRVERVSGRAVEQHALQVGREKRLIEQRS